MPRIRTIKPEFPQSESIGRVSRDARLTFILLWTLADDSGRLRGNSRMLASLLYPYDSDAGTLVDGWLAELDKVGCLVRYVINGDTYIQICNWLKHQKIDKPSQSKIPEFGESSRILANPLERSSGDLRIGSKDLRIKDQGSLTELASLRSPAPRKRCPENFQITEAMRAWATDKCPWVNLDQETEAFRDYEFARGKTDWTATWRTWMRKVPRPKTAIPLKDRLTWRPGADDVPV